MDEQALGEGGFVMRIGGDELGLLHLGTRRLGTGDQRGGQPGQQGQRELGFHVTASRSRFE